MLLEGEIEDRPLQLDLVVLLLTCLATSYSNLAAPLDTVFLFLGSSESIGAARDATISTSVQTGRATSCAPVWTDKSGANFLICIKLVLIFGKRGARCVMAEPPLAEKLTLGASDLRFLLTNHGIKDDHQGGPLPCGGRYDG